MKFRLRQSTVIILAMIILMAFSAVDAFQLHAQEISKQQLEQMKFRHIGPLSATGLYLQQEFRMIH